MDYLEARALRGRFALAKIAKRDEPTRVEIRDDSGEVVDGFDRRWTPELD